MMAVKQHVSPTFQSHQSESAGDPLTQVAAGLQQTRDKILSDSQALASFLLDFPSSLVPTFSFI